MKRSFGSAFDNQTEEQASVTSASSSNTDRNRSWEMQSASNQVTPEQPVRESRVLNVLLTRIPNRVLLEKLRNQAVTTRDPVVRVRRLNLEELGYGRASGSVERYAGIPARPNRSTQNLSDVQSSRRRLLTDMSSISSISTTDLDDSEEEFLVQTPPNIPAICLKDSKTPERSKKRCGGGTSFCSFAAGSSEASDILLGSYISIQSKNALTKVINHAKLDPFNGEFQTLIDEFVDQVHSQLYNEVRLTAAAVLLDGVGKLCIRQMTKLYELMVEFQLYVSGVKQKEKKKRRANRKTELADCESTNSETQNSEACTSTVVAVLINLSEEEETETSIQLTRNEGGSTITNETAIYTNSDNISELTTQDDTASTLTQTSVCNYSAATIGDEESTILAESSIHNIDELSEVSQNALLESLTLDSTYSIHSDAPTNQPTVPSQDSGYNTQQTQPCSPPNKFSESNLIHSTPCYYELRTQASSVGGRPSCCGMKGAKRKSRKESMKVGKGESNPSATSTIEVEIIRAEQSSPCLVNTMLEVNPTEATIHVNENTLSSVAPGESLAATEITHSDNLLLENNNESTQNTKSFRISSLSRRDFMEKLRKNLAAVVRDGLANQPPVDDAAVKEFVSRMKSLLEAEEKRGEFSLAKYEQEFLEVGLKCSRQGDENSAHIDDRNNSLCVSVLETFSQVKKFDKLEASRYFSAFLGLLSYKNVIIDYDTLCSEESNSSHMNDNSIGLKILKSRRVDLNTDEVHVSIMSSVSRTVAFEQAETNISGTILPGEDASLEELPNSSSIFSKFQAVQDQQMEYDDGALFSRRAQARKRKLVELPVLASSEGLTRLTE